MKLNLFGVLTLLLCALGVQAANVKGNGNVVTRDITVGEFDQIEMAISGNSINFGLFGGGSNKGKTPTFNYKQTGGKSTLQVTTDENLFEHLQIDSSGGKLVVRVKRNTKISPTQLILNGTSKNLRYLSVSGGADFFMQNAFSGDKLEVSVSGGSDVYMKNPVKLDKALINTSGGSDLVADNLVCSKLEVSVSGGSDAKLKGKAEQARYSASGGADINAYDLIVRQLECSASGGADIEAYATETIKASASGGADVYYKGDAEAQISKSGGGSVKKK